MFEAEKKICKNLGGIKIDLNGDIEEIRKEDALSQFACNDPIKQVLQTEGAQLIRKHGFGVLFIVFSVC